MKNIPSVCVALLFFACPAFGKVGWNGPKTTTHEMARGEPEIGGLYEFDGRIVSRLSGNEIQITNGNYSVFLHCSTNLPKQWIQNSWAAVVLKYEGQISYKNVLGATQIAGKGKIVFVPAAGWLDEDHKEEFLEHWQEDTKTLEKVSKRGKVGILIGSDFVIQKVIEGSPAEDAGLKVGDRVTKVDRRSVGRDYYKMLMRITGRPNTKLKIEVLRDGEPMVFDLVRGEPEIGAGELEKK